MSQSMTQPGQIHVFDRALLRRRRARAVPGFARHRFLHDEIDARLLERLADVRRNFPIVLDLGCRDGALGRQLSALNPQRRVFATDPAFAFARASGLPTVVLDEELLPFAPASFDLIVSNLNLHWVNDLPGALVQIRACLKPDGMFLAAMLGGATLHELRDCLMEAEARIMGGVSPRLSPYADLRDMAMLLQRAGFALPVADGEKIEVTYDNLFALMRDLRAMGESNAVSARLRTPARRALFLEAARLYAERYADATGRIAATFEVLWLHGWKSQ